MYNDSMIEDYFSNSHISVVGPRASSRSSVRKLITDLGASPKNLQTFITISEANEGIRDFPCNILLYDDDCKDYGDFKRLLKIFLEQLDDQSDPLIILLISESNLYLQDEIPSEYSVIAIEKPYTVGSFNDTIEDFFYHKQLEQQAQQKESAIKVKAQNAYEDFEVYLTNNLSENPGDQFFKLCEDFIHSLKENIDYESLDKILVQGINLRRFKDLDFFVTGWLNSLPIQPQHVPDLSRVILYNKRFELLEKIQQTEDKQAQLAIGVGLVLAASIYSEDESKQKQVLKYVLSGVRLSQYKPIVVLKALEVLVKINCKVEASDLIESSQIESNLASVSDEISEPLGSLIEQIRS